MPTRRHALQIGAATAVAGAAGPLAAQEPDRLNILWLVSEGNNPFIGGYA